MDTLAVVCDDNIECHEDRDEKLCASGGMSTAACFGLACGTCLIYVGLKLAWWFKYRHMPVGDEDDDVYIREEDSEVQK